MDFFQTKAESYPKNTVFFVLPGKFASAAQSIKESCEQAYAVGMLNKKLLFVNKAILESLCEQDRADVVNIVKAHTGIVLTEEDDKKAEKNNEGKCKKQ